MIYRKLWSVPSQGDGLSPVTVLLGLVSQYSDGADKFAQSMGLQGTPVVDHIHMREEEPMYEMQLLFKSGKGSWFCNMCSRSEIMQLLKSDANWEELEHAIDHILSDKVQEFVYHGKAENADTAEGISYLRIVNKGQIRYLLAS